MPFIINDQSFNFLRYWTLIMLLSCFIAFGNVWASEGASFNSYLTIYEYNKATSTATTDIFTITNLIDNSISGSSHLFFHKLPQTKAPIGNHSVLLQIGKDATENSRFILSISTASLGDTTKRNPSLGYVILYSFIGVTVTNLCAVFGLLCIPARRFKCYGEILSFMLALAVGSLVSTAFLVLIPESMRMADMPEEFGGGPRRLYLFKMGSILVGAIFFFILEYFLSKLPRVFSKFRDNTPCAGLPQLSGTGDILREWDEHGHLHNHALPTENGHKKIVLNCVDGLYLDGEMAENDEATYKYSCCKYLTKMAPIAWMIFIGDGVHNMMDGLTIGAGFSKSYTVGLTLTLSVLFEELPHELGDFAILITSGLSVKAALLANFLSACSAYVGLVIGIALGEVPSGAFYVFGVTAGLFLYISLSDMLPAMRNNLEEIGRKSGKNLSMFLVQLLGIIIGFVCILSVTILSDYIYF